MCASATQAGCTEQPADDGIGISFTVPEGWQSTPPDGIGSATWFDTADGAGLLFARGGWLFDDPCRSDESAPTIAVGPTVDELASALAAQTKLDVTTPVDVALAGYDGKYLELNVPSDLIGCDVWQPWAPWYYAKNPGERWRLWILDVEGVRVVVQAMDYAITPDELRTQLQQIVDSIGITFTPSPEASPSAASSAVASGNPIAWTPGSVEADWPAPVRAEPVGSPVTLYAHSTLAPDPGDWSQPMYGDPIGDVSASAASWVDLETITVSGDEIELAVAGSITPGAPKPDEAWIAYGVVVDNDLDGIADVRYGIVNLPTGLGLRAWITNLRTGKTESEVGVPSGFVGRTHFDPFYPEGPGGRARFYGPGAPRFYAWASLIQDGRVVATDYAPDAGWLFARASG